MQDGSTMRDAGQSLRRVADVFDRNPRGQSSLGRHVEVPVDDLVVLVEAHALDVRALGKLHVEAVPAGLAVARSSP